MFIIVFSDTEMYTPEPVRALGYFATEAEAQAEIDRLLEDEWFSEWTSVYSPNIVPIHNRDELMAIVRAQVDGSDV